MCAHTEHLKLDWLRKVQYNKNKGNKMDGWHEKFILDEGYEK